MDKTPIPIVWEHPLACPSFNYFDTFTILENEWNWKDRYKTEPMGSKQWLEYRFWRQVSVIWACAAIEAFVNEEGAAWVGPDWYKKNVERGRIEEKIQVLYALKYRQLLPSKLPQLKQVNLLFDLRNELVHPKARYSRNDEKGKPSGLNLYEMEFRDLRKAFWGITNLFEPKGVGDKRKAPSERPSA
jgi:hypothetical protein